jgi:hypothetical protein
MGAGVRSGLSLASLIGGRPLLSDTSSSRMRDYAAQVSGRPGWMNLRSDELRKQLKETATTKVIDSIHVENGDGVQKDLKKIT